MRMSTLSAEDPKGPAEQRHNIEVYFPDVYDEKVAKEVSDRPCWGQMRLMSLGHDGTPPASWIEVVWSESGSVYRDWFVSLRSRESLSYCILGLDSKHASGIPSTVSL